MKHHDGMTEIERTASDAVAQLLEEYAATIGTASHEIEESVWQAAYRIAAVEIIPEADRPAGYATATDDDRATVAHMVEAIADRARETAALAHYQTADAAARAASSFAEAAEWAADKIENDPAADLAEMAHAARIFAAHAQDAADAARLICDNDRMTTFADYETSAYAAHAIELQEIYAADAAAAADRALAAAQRATDAANAAADPEDLEEPAPLYQRYELLAYLGEPDDYDVEAIEAEATRYTADGARVWCAFGDDLAAIAERHELFTYYAI